MTPLNPLNVYTEAERGLNLLYQVQCSWIKILSVLFT